ncbi:MAG: tRNA pseudouridine(38-40) synthase TruA [Rhodothermaceae bacterium]
MNQKNYKLEIQYDGTDYAGWQFQPNVVSVQQKIEECLSKILNKDTTIIGSGRTDSGVHAFGQVANFNTEKELDNFKFTYALNGLLPDDISIKNLKEVNPEFHSRFDATRRSYYYFISKYKNPFYKKYSYFFKGWRNYDFWRMNKTAKILLGEKDFTSLAKKKTEVKNKVCDLREIQIRETKNFVIFYVEANRFLHGMVRATVGTLLESAKHDYSPDYLLDVLKAQNRDVAGRAVPAEGLFLYKVKY